MWRSLKTALFIFLPAITTARRVNCPDSPDWLACRGFIRMRGAAAKGNISTRDVDRSKWINPSAAQPTPEHDTQSAAPLSSVITAPNSLTVEEMASHFRLGWMVRYKLYIRSLGIFFIFIFPLSNGKQFSHHCSYGVQRFLHTQYILTLIKTNAYQKSLLFRYIPMTNSRLLLMLLLLLTVPLWLLHDKRITTDFNTLHIWYYR